MEQTVAQSEDGYILTGDEVTEACVRFEVIMGWIDGTSTALHDGSRGRP
jgi:hypothetical protein